MPQGDQLSHEFPGAGEFRAGSEDTGGQSEAKEAAAKPEDVGDDKSPMVKES